MSTIMNGDRLYKTIQLQTGNIVYNITCYIKKFVYEANIFWLINLITAYLKGLYRLLTHH